MAKSDKKVRVKAADKQDNELRLVAADVIQRLYESKNASQLRLLEMQARRSLEELGQRTVGDRLLVLCRELDIEMDGVRCPATAAAILNGIRRVIGDEE